MAYGVAYLGVRNVTQLAKGFASQTVLSPKVREVRQNAIKPPIEAQGMAGNTEERTKPAVDRAPAAAELGAGSGTRTIVTTMPEVREASLKVAKSAQRLLSIFTQDLEPLIYGEEPFLEAIKRLVLARSYAKVRVLLADPSRAMVDNNRFLALARRLTSCIDLRAMSPEYPASAGAFIIADDKALVYRLQADRWDGISDMNDPAVVRRYLNFFDEVWQTSMQESQMRQMLM
jgi:hypothetical protein